MSPNSSSKRRRLSKKVIGIARTPNKTDMNLIAKSEVPNKATQ